MSTTVSIRMEKKCGKKERSEKKNQGKKRLRSTWREWKKKIFRKKQAKKRKKDKRNLLVDLLVDIYNKWSQDQDLKESR